VLLVRLPGALQCAPVTVLPWSGQFKCLDPPNRSVPAPSCCIIKMPPAENELEEEVREALLARFKAHGRRGGAADQASSGLCVLHLSPQTAGHFLVAAPFKTAVKCALCSSVPFTLMLRAGPSPPVACLLVPSRSGLSCSRSRATFLTLGLRAAAARCAGCTRWAVVVGGSGSEGLCGMRCFNHASNITKPAPHHAWQPLMHCIPILSHVTMPSCTACTCRPRTSTATWGSCRTSWWRSTLSTWRQRR
jgi:hypothetical protein